MSKWPSPKTPLGARLPIALFFGAVGCDPPRWGRAGADRLRISYEGRFLEQTSQTFVCRLVRHLLLKRCSRRFSAVEVLRSGRTAKGRAGKREPVRTKSMRCFKRVHD